MTDGSKESFRDWFGRLLEEKKISQSRLALYSGVSRSEINRFLKKKRGRFTPESLAKIAPVLKVPYIELYERAGYPPLRGVDKEEAYLLSIFGLLSDDSKKQAIDYLNYLLSKQPEKRGEAIS